MTTEHDDLHRRIAQRLRRALDRKHWTLRELAAASGVSTTQIHRVLHCQSSPTIGILARLSRGSGIKLTRMVS